MTSKPNKKNLEYPVFRVSWAQILGIKGGLHLIWIIEKVFLIPQYWNVSKVKFWKFYNECSFRTHLLNELDLKIVQSSFYSELGGPIGEQ